MDVTSRRWEWVSWESMIRLSDLGGATSGQISMCMEFRLSLGPLINAGIFVRSGFSLGPKRADVFWISSKGKICSQNRRGTLKAMARIYVEGVRMALGMHPPDMIHIPHVRMRNYEIRSIHGRVTRAEARGIICMLIRIYGYKERLYAYPS
jgi:hypothetical protein